MKRVLLALAVVLLAGCSHSSVVLDSRAGGSAVQVRADSGSDFVRLLMLTFLAAGMVEFERERGRDYYSFGNRTAPELLDERLVSEHDCTRPIEPLSGNLRCR
ncbi:MAG TPA: hypothetical protein VD965_11650 [Burkholderiales bacterium]|nr:hypothetical protein [Burkholderiales bacterium]